MHLLNLVKKLYLRMVQFTMVSGLATKSMVMVFKNGLMAPDMKVCGSFQRHVVKGSFGTSMAISLKESGLTTKQMDLEYIHIPMEQTILATGKMICNMVKARNIGLMGVSTLETIAKVKSMDWDSIGGLMAVLLTVIGLITK